MVIFCIFCAAVGGVLSYFFSKPAILIATSLIGSYSFMRGWSYFFGGYPNEAEIILSLYKNLDI